MVHGFVFVLVLAAYHGTMAPGLVEIDSGELAAVQCTHGVAHPTGYVLYTWLGFLWSKLPFFPSVIYGLNFFAAVCTALSANLVLAGVLKMHAGPEGTPRDIQYCIGITVALSYAFFGLVWKQGTSVEVYSFQLPLMALLLYGVSVVYRQPEKKSGPYLLGALLGLVLGHHLMGFFLLPGLLVFLVRQSKANTVGVLVKVLGMASACLMLQYGILYVNALSAPELNWGDPSDAGRLWKHITGKQYRSSMLVPESYGARWLSFWADMPSGVAFVSLPLALVGLFWGFRRYASLHVFLLLIAGLVVACVPLYAIRDIDNYFLPFYLVLAYWMASGLFCLARIRKALVLPFLVLPVLLFLMNRPAADRSRDTYIQHYTALFFEKMPPDALYIGYAWDILISPTYYCQYCEQQRRDVVVLDKLQMGQSWYYGQLDPELFRGMEAEKDAWVKKLEAHEAGDGDGYELRQEFTLFLQKLMAVNMGWRPVILSFEVFKNNVGKDVLLPPGTVPVPTEFGFRIGYGTTYMPIRNYLEPLIDFKGKDDFYTGLIIEDRVNLWTVRYLYELQYGKLSAANKCISILRERYPDHPNTRKLSKLLNKRQ